MVDGNFATMMNIVRAYIGVDFNVCTPTELVCVLNYNGCGYNFIAELIKHDRIHLNVLIDKHDVDIKPLKNLSGLKNEFEFESTSYHKSIKSWS